MAEPRQYHPVTVQFQPGTTMGYVALDIDIIDRLLTGDCVLAPGFFVRVTGERDLKELTLIQVRQADNE